MTSRGAVLVTLGLLAAGCSGGSSTPQALVSSAPATPSPTVSPTAAATKAAPAAATSSAPSASPTVKAGTKDFGYFREIVDADPTLLSFDRATFLTGDAAARAAAAHGQEAFDYYIQNDNRLLRRVVVADDVKVVGSLQLNTFAGHESVDPQPQTLRTLLGFLGTATGRTTPFHLVYGTGGTVVSIEEQYLP